MVYPPTIARDRCGKDDRRVERYLLLTNRKIYVVDKYITFKKEQYFNINYGRKFENIFYQLVKELDDYKIYEVCVER